MREIKFRIWNTKYKEMGEVFTLQQALSEDHLISDHLIYMQFTSLKDKNGVEIYEGDWLKLSNGSILVGWQVAGFVGYRPVEIVDHKPKFIQELKHSTELGWFPNEFEVIGNIYENPELLEPSHD